MAACRRDARARLLSRKRRMHSALSRAPRIPWLARTSVSWRTSSSCSIHCAQCHGSSSRLAGSCKKVLLSVTHTGTVVTKLLLPYKNHVHRTTSSTEDLVMRYTGTQTAHSCANRTFMSLWTACSHAVDTSMHLAA